MTIPPDEPVPSKTSAEQTPAVAVWYFVSATFVFAFPSFFPDLDLWVRIVSMAFGMLLIVLGGIQLGKEVKAHQQKRTPDNG